MKKKELCACLVILSLIFCPPAYAITWTRVKGTLYITYFEDSDGNTIDALPASDRIIRINEKINNAPGIKSKCKTNKALQQKVCNQTYYYEVQGQGSCRYERKIIYNKFTSTSRKIVTYIEAAMTCPSGYGAYFLASGTLRRS